MKQFVKVMALVFAVAMVATCFTGCGAKKDSDNKTTTTTAKTAAVKVIDIPLTDELYAFGVAKDDAALLASVNTFIAKIKGDGTFEKIVNNYFGDGAPVAVTSAKEDKSKDQLIVVTNAEFAPFEYMKGDSYYGIDMEIAKQLADELKKELVIKNVDFDAVCSNINSGYGDIAMAGLTINEKRKEFVTFTDSYYTASQVIIAKGSDTAFDACKAKEDVEKILNAFDAKTTIGVQTGTTGQYYVEGSADWDFTGYKATCKGYSSGSLAVQDMMNGSINYVIIDQAPAASIAKAINAVN